MAVFSSISNLYFWLRMRKVSLHLVFLCFVWHKIALFYKHVVLFVHQTVFKDLAVIHSLHFGYNSCYKLLGQK